MKRSNIFQSIGLLGFLFVSCLPAWSATPLQSAEVTRLFNRVDLLSADLAPRPATIGDTVAGRMAVQTGERSRAELAFADDTIARLGANSLFSFEQGTRDLNLREGVLLLQVPKNAGGANVNTAAVSAAITGTTILVESRPPSREFRQGIIKFLVLEGTMRLRLNGQVGEAVLIGQGQMVTLDPSAQKLPDPVVFDIRRLIETSGLLGSEFQPLNNLPFILEAAQVQRQLQNQGRLINLNYGILADRNPTSRLLGMTTQASNRANAQAPEILQARRQPVQQVPNRTVQRQAAPTVNQNTPPSINDTRQVELRTLRRLREQAACKPCSKDK